MLSLAIGVGPSALVDREVRVQLVDSNSAAMEEADKRAATAVNVNLMVVSLSDGFR